MDILEAIGKVISYQQVLIIAILIVVNFCSGVLAGVMTKTLCWSEIGGINKRAGIMFGLYLVLCVPAYFLANKYGTDWEALRGLASAGVIAFLVDKILVNLKELGIPLPARTENGVVSAKQRVPNGTKVTSVLCALPVLNLLSKNMK